MSCLFYCICRHPGPVLPAPLLGVGGGPVYQVKHGLLGAAVSRIARTDLAPDLSMVRAYDRVVHSYHRQDTVIPMRYGCVVGQESQVIRLLDEHHRQYEALLQELEGCVEMGVRVLLPAASLPAVSSRDLQGSPEDRRPPLAAAAATPDRPGLAYLTARKAHYVHQDCWTKEYRQAADRCLAQFAGLFVKAKTEAPSPRLPLLSLYFLVPRALVESFRQAFRRLRVAEPTGLLLSGPWPPYNFVTGAPSLSEAPSWERDGSHG